MKKTKTAGGVVIHKVTRKILIVNQNNNSWSLPKGHVDPGETAKEAAIREIHEESGVKNPIYIKELGLYERFKIGLNGQDDTSELKEIEMFLFETEQNTLCPTDPLNPEAKWVNAEDVVGILTHPADVNFFKEFVRKYGSEIT